MYLTLKIPKIALLLLFSFSLFFSINSYAEDNSEAFLASIELLKSKKYKEKEKGINQLIDTKDSRVQKILEALLNSRLFLLKESIRLLTN